MLICHAVASGEVNIPTNVDKSEGFFYFTDKLIEQFLLAVGLFLTI